MDATTYNSHALRYFALVVLLSLLCALCGACHSSAEAGVSAAPAASAVKTAAQPWPTTAPTEPLDERLITPTESAGAPAS